MGAAGVVSLAPGVQGGLEFGPALPVLEPDALQLQGLDQALGHGVAGGAAHGGEGVVQLPRRAEVAAIGGGLLGPVVGAQLQTLRHGFGAAEGLQQGLSDGGQHGSWVRTTGRTAWRRQWRNRILM